MLILMSASVAITYNIYKKDWKKFNMYNNILTIIKTNIIKLNLLKINAYPILLIIILII